MTSSIGQQLGQWRNWDIVWWHGACAEKRKHVMFAVKAVVTPPSHSQQGPRSGENVQRKREHKEADTQHKKASAKRGRRERRKYAVMLACSAYCTYRESRDAACFWVCASLKRREQHVERARRERENINNCYLYLLLLQTYIHKHIQMHTRSCGYLFGC